MQVWHFRGQKLRLGGDALGADPTYLLYLAYRSQGELRRIDFGPGCAGATWSYFIGPQAWQESTAVKEASTFIKWLRSVCTLGSWHGMGGAHALTITVLGSAHIPRARAPALPKRSTRSLCSLALP